MVFCPFENVFGEVDALDVRTRLRITFYKRKPPVRGYKGENRYYCFNVAENAGLCSFQNAWKGLGGRMLLFSLIFIIHYFSLRQLKVCLAKFGPEYEMGIWKLGTSKQVRNVLLQSRRAQQNVFSNIEKFLKKVIRNRVLR